MNSKIGKIKAIYVLLFLKEWQSKREKDALDFRSLVLCKNKHKHVL